MDRLHGLTFVSLQLSHVLHLLVQNTAFSKTVTISGQGPITTPLWGDP